MRTLGPGAGLDAGRLVFRQIARQLLEPLAVHLDVGLHFVPRLLGVLQLFLLGAACLLAMLDRLLDTRHLGAELLQDPRLSPAIE